jgi:hypothetical protein
MFEHRNPDNCYKLQVIYVLQTRQLKYTYEN